jgi:hypothetical protein
MKDIDELIKYLKENDIDPKVALNILKREFATDKAGHKKTVWKMIKFQLYIWQRMKDPKTTRVEAVTELVNSAQYKKAYDQFPNPPFDAEKEILNLTKLISDNRQDKFFISKNFTHYGRPTQKLPQALIDKLR